MPLEYEDWDQLFKQNQALTAEFSGLAEVYREGAGMINNAVNRAKNWVDTTGEQRLAAEAAKYGSRHYTFYIDSVNGDDDSTDADKESGTGFLTMAPVFSRVPENVSCDIILKNDFVWNEKTGFRNWGYRRFRLAGRGLYSISYEPYLYDSGQGVNYYTLYNARTPSGAKSFAISFQAIEFKLPSKPHDFDERGYHNSQSSIVSSNLGYGPGLIQATFNNCHFDQPDDGFVSMVGAGNKMAAIGVNACTGMNKMPGFILAGAPAGSLVADNPRVISTRTSL